MKFLVSTILWSKNSNQLNYEIFCCWYSENSEVQKLHLDSAKREIVLICRYSKDASIFISFTRFAYCDRFTTIRTKIMWMWDRLLFQPCYVKIVINHLYFFCSRFDIRAEEDIPLLLVILNWIGTSFWLRYSIYYWWVFIIIHCENESLIRHYLGINKFL